MSRTSSVRYTSDKYKFSYLLINLFELIGGYGKMINEYGTLLSQFLNGKIGKNRANNQFSL